MSATGEINRFDLRHVIAGLFKPKYAERLVLTEATGDTSETDFLVPANHEPFQVFENGSLKQEGSGNDYTITDNGFNKTVVFNSAPAAVPIQIFSYVRL